MPRSRIILSEEHPYHVNVRSNNRDWFDLPISFCYFTFIEMLAKTQQKYEIEVHLFLLMSNHFHMLISTPQANISAAMRYFLTESSRRLRVESLRINHIFGGRYHSSLIESEDYFTYVYKYILRNPVKAKIVERVEDYPWSTEYSSLHEIKELKLTEPNGHSTYIPSDKAELSDWLNTPFQSELEDSIRKGLKRGSFAFPRDPKSKRAADWSKHLPPIKRRVAKKE